VRGVSTSEHFWGGFEKPDGTYHICPCNSEGVVIAPHVTSILCSCGPAIGDDRTVIHEEIQ
jgi:hypothetical protein